MSIDELIKLGQIILVDLVLAGDNAIVIGLVAAKFTAEHRRRVILYGIGGAVVLRIVFAVITVQLLAVKGLMLAGGALLLWICWKLWLDLRAPPRAAFAEVDEVGTSDAQADGFEMSNAQVAGVEMRNTQADGVNTPNTRVAEIEMPNAGNPPMLSSIMQILIADLSMSLDNVLAVAGIAEGHVWLLVLGLAISVAFMTFAATMIANLLQKHRWIGYVGLAMIVYVALKMIYHGSIEVLLLI
ncbi:MAG: YjbE family putative metal transport protein [bacterium]